MCTPAITVGGINSRWFGPARQGTNQPPEPTATTYRTHKGRSFSLCWDHGGSGDTAAIKGSRGSAL